MLWKLWNLLSHSFHSGTTATREKKDTNGLERDREYLNFMSTKPGAGSKVVPISLAAGIAPF
jgi:hypothetical protein